MEGSDSEFTPLCWSHLLFHEDILERTRSIYFCVCVIPHTQYGFMWLLFSIVEHKKYVEWNKTHSSQVQKVRSLIVTD